MKCSGAQRLKISSLRNVSAHVRPKRENLEPNKQCGLLTFIIPAFKIERASIKSILALTYKRFFFKYQFHNYGGPHSASVALNFSFVQTKI